ncbi:Ku protein, partial [Nitrospira sp. BLG_2]|uniref:non-homologous end joining protein Ku n=1 Tax=Nitrospira sp. BLG_2 TaxID=3397507 RepID=UPI003B9C9E4B
VEATQTVDILRFVDEEDIAPMYFESPYYLAPEARGEKGYVLLRDILKQTHKMGIANVVISTRQYVAALLPVNDMILMNTLRYADEVKDAKELDILPKRKNVGVTAKEREMAVKLVEEMTGEWDPNDYHDTYREDLLKLIEKRIKTGRTEMIGGPDGEEVLAPPKRGKVVDLMALLKRSVRDKAKGRRFSSAHQRTEGRSDRSRRKTG